MALAACGVRVVPGMGACGCRVSGSNVDTLGHLPGGCTGWLHVLLGVTTVIR